MLIYSLIIIIFSSGVNLNRDKSITYSRILSLVLLNCVIISYNNLYFTSLGEIGEGIGIFGGLFSISTINATFTIFLLLISFLIVNLTSFYPRKLLIKEQSGIIAKIFSFFNFNKSKILNIMNEQYKIIEYSLIIIFVIIGGIFLMSSNDLISIFLSIELQSYGLYIISSIYRNSESSTSAGLTYFLLGALASCFILLSAGLLYSNTGFTSLDNLYVISNITEMMSDSLQDSNLYITKYKSFNSNFLEISLIILSIGFLFKISAAPFHFWSPDVYDAVPTIVTTFIAIVAKITIFIFFFELINHIYNNFNYIYDWTIIFIFSSLLSLIIGTVLGLTQIRIKRLYAYSTISHIGFILLALNIKSTESIQAFLFYLIQYSLSNLNAFFILIAIGYSLYFYVHKNKSIENDVILKERNNSPIQLISQLKGYFYVNAHLSLSLAITLFSFIGIPPLIGFFAKFMVLSSAIDKGYVFMSVLIVLTSVIGGVYYLVIIKHIFFDSSIYKLNNSLKNLSLNLFIFYKNLKSKVPFNIDKITLNSSLSTTISLLTSFTTFLPLSPAHPVFLKNWWLSF